MFLWMFMNSSMRHTFADEHFQVFPVTSRPVRKIDKRISYNISESAIIDVELTFDVAVIRTSLVAVEVSIISVPTSLAEFNVELTVAVTSLAWWSLEMERGMR